jgi:hypothetical protein
MKRTIIVLCVSLAVTHLFACTSTSVPATTTPTAAAIEVELPPDVLAIHHKSGGIAGIDETLTVYQGGLLELSTRGEILKSLMVNEPLLIPLRSTLEQKEFSELEPSYRAVGADLISYTITSWDSQGNAKTITTMDSAKHPDYLDLLIGMFEQLRGIVAKNG